MKPAVSGETDLAKQGGRWHWVAERGARTWGGGQGRTSWRGGARTSLGEGLGSSSGWIRGLAQKQRTLSPSLPTGDPSPPLAGSSSRLSSAQVDK